MEITGVRVKLWNDDRLKAFANITFDDCFMVCGLKVIQGNEGYFVAMPSRKRPDGSYKDIAHPINGRMRQLMEDTVMRAYETELQQQRQSA